MPRRIIRPFPMRRSVLTLGTFDGVHRGHQMLLRRVLQRARPLRAKSVVLAFDMPPRHVGDLSEKSILLTTLPEKLEILHRLGIDTVQVLTFDRATANTSPESFFNETILKKHHAAAMIVGPRVAFGKNRTGRLPLLKQLGKKKGVRIDVVSAVKSRMTSVASRRIRAFLSAGRVDKAASLLGYPYSVKGRVVHGDHRGRRLGYPTANLRPDMGKILPQGVFWVKVLPGSAPVPLSSKDLKSASDGLCNVGTRPTFTPNSHELRCEVFLFDQKKNLYGRHLRVVFMRKIRAERRFSSPKTLTRQIDADFRRAKHWASRFSFTK